MWIGTCGHYTTQGNCTEWVQTGTFQGVVNQFLNSPNAVHIYYENMDPCGTYYARDLGTPPSADYFYSIRYDNAGPSTFVCNGVPFSGYTYDYTKGSSSTPFFFGVLSHSSGGTQALTERHSPSSMTYNFFGCDPGLTCANSGYGLDLYFSSWQLWTTSIASTPTQYDPPYLHTYNSRWAFKTCPVAC